MLMDTVSQELGQGMAGTAHLWLMMAEAPVRKTWRLRLT